MAHAQLVEKGSAQLLELHRSLERQPGFAATVAALRAGSTVSFDGVWGSSSALLATSLWNQAPATLVVVCSQQAEIDAFADDLAVFTQQAVERFPAWENDRRERRVHDDIYADRLRTLKLLLDPAARHLVVTSISSLLQPLPDRSAVEASTRRLRRGARIDPEQLVRWLVEHGFHHTTAVALPGECSQRGGILDVFAPDWYQPVRIELFDDEIESLRTFDLESQRSLESLAEVEITMLQPSLAAGWQLADYLPPGSWVLLHEPDRIQAEARDYVARQQGGDQPAGQDGCLPVEQVFAGLSRFGLATAGALLTSTAETNCRLAIESVERFSGDVSKVRDELDQLARDRHVYLVADTEAEAQRLSEIMQATRLATDGRFKFPVGNLQSGFHLLPERLLVLSAHELFHRGQVRRPGRRRMGKAIDSFLDLRSGDLVVHLAHGIGRYRGLELLTKEQHIEEHLVIEFHGGTKVFVPASKIDLVQKYVGGTKTRPTLARLGGKSWVRQKQAAAAAVVDLASDMLALQAQRASLPGIAFQDNSEWQHEFEASFPYQETADQLASWEEIRRDMGRPRPMDRLLCGDVGFGKTELAMRAAFKAVDNGYQVAVLVPTTILAEQHHQNFRERMAEFPFDIAKLSRFCGPGEQRQVIAGLRTGLVDIVIGTHRLASRDVQFHNLGLVIIDEEQRFGVEVKERLKTLRSTVDVLTLSATPIPRTLHMSLVGVRDISNLETPPAERVAVETRVAAFDEQLIRHAVLRELDRGGQIYFVHNRVQDIHQVAFKLHHIVPEARLRIGHGQMPEAELEEVMVDFVAHRFDLLLATTIVESGLDIPNANTVFVNEAERYGLADLHQLRGRVGRYKNRAYCYLLVEPHKHLTPNAARRLRAIEEFSDMGAGFAISMRDLEIRGAGNLLGTEQSGHIAAVGYELYCQLLENAVRELKQMPQPLRADVDLDLPGEAHLPSNYVPDQRSKIDLYRRLARAADFNELAELATEIPDRFGPMPACVQRLLALAELRLEAAVWQIQAVYIEEQFLVFRYADRRRIEQLAKTHRGRLRLVDQKSAYWPLGPSRRSPDQLLQLVKSVLRPQ
ncbi:MAG: transcription-repair coupling factor [Pirellulaceae bacterium]|nr:transcription-repair coupling factor [Pirellulaceae bacterium]